MIENQELQQRIAAYIDGKLSPAEAARLEVYLANTDPALADAIVGMLSDKVQLKALARPRAPADLSGRIMEQIERSSLLQEHAAAGPRPWWQSRTAMAAGLAVVLGGFSYFVITSVHRPEVTPLAVGTGGGGPVATGGGGPVTMDNNRDGVASGPAPVVPAAPGPVSPTPSAQPGPALVMAGPKDSAVMPPAMPVAATAPASMAVGNGETGAVQVAMAPTTQPDEETGRMVARGPEVVQPAMGGGGGGGRSAGGRGGRGGAGGGAAGAGGAGGGGGFGGGGGRGGRAAAAITAPTAMLDAMQTMAPSTDNTLKALEALSQKDNGPVIVTLYARDEQDYARLANALMAYAAANAEQTINHVLPQSQSVLANNGGTADDPRNSVREQQSPGSQAPAAAAVANDLRFNNLSGTGSVAVNGSGVIILNGPPSSLGNVSLQNFAAAANYDNAGSGNFTINLGQTAAPQAGGFSGGQLAGVDQNAGGNAAGSPAGSGDQRTARIVKSLQAAAAHGGPYRVALRQDQIEELSRNYRVALVARGSAVYEFHVTGDRDPSTANAADRADLLRKAEVDGGAAAGAPVPAGGNAGAAFNNGAASTAAPVENKFSGSGTMGGDTMTVGGSNSLGGTQVVAGTATLSGNISGGGAALSKAGAGSLTLSPAATDYVITMEAAPDGSQQK